MQLRVLKVLMNIGWDSLVNEMKQHSFTDRITLSLDVGMVNVAWKFS